MKRKLSNPDNDDQPPQKQIKVADCDPGVSNGDDHDNANNNIKSEMKWTSLFQGTLIKISSYLEDRDCESRFKTKLQKDALVDLSATIKNKQGIFFLTQSSCDYLVCGFIRKYITDDNTCASSRLLTPIKNVVLKYTHSNRISIVKCSNRNSSIMIKFYAVNMKIQESSYSKGDTDSDRDSKDSNSNNSVIDDILVRWKFNQVCAPSKNGDINDDDIKEYLKYHKFNYGKRPRLPWFYIEPFNSRINVTSNGYRFTNDSEFHRVFFYDLCPLEDGDQLEYDSKKLTHFESLDKFEERYHEDKRNHLPYMKQLYVRRDQKSICRRKWFQDLGTDGNHLEKQLRDQLVFKANYKDNYCQLFRNDDQMKNNNPFFKLDNDGKRRLVHRGADSTILEFSCWDTGKLNMSIDVLFNPTNLEKHMSK